MAVYDGFFDAALAGENTDGSPQYDRVYGADDFTEYFARVLGSGVCVYENPASCRVSLADGAAHVAPGFLFIRGYWLRIRDEPYTVGITGTQPVAVVAQLDTARRLIELKTLPPADAYPDALCLALVDPASGTVEDTRADPAVCGLLETSGALAAKAAWAQDYIDNEIAARLGAAESDLRAQSAAIDARIAAMQATVDGITPPAVGTVRFSASQDVGEDWLRCDGSFVSERDYPELVAALGRLAPSGDRFTLLPADGIGPQITNGVLYGGRLWTYSTQERKLYGIDTAGEQPVKVIPVTSENAHFGDFDPQNQNNPVCLSIVPHTVGTGATLFLAQLKKGDKSQEEIAQEAFASAGLYLFSSAFSGEEDTVSVAYPFQSITNNYGRLEVNPDVFIPYVVSRAEAGTEFFYCAFSTTYSISGGDYYTANGIDVLKWSGAEATVSRIGVFYSKKGVLPKQKMCMSRHSRGEIVAIDIPDHIVTRIRSYPSGLFNGTDTKSSLFERNIPLALNVAGASRVTGMFDEKNFNNVPLAESEGAKVETGLVLPAGSRIFYDAACYLWGKDMFLIFVGTGLIFTRDFSEGSFGFLNTTDVLGTITQFGCLDYTEDEGTLYLLGQDTENRVRAAKLVLNTLYDYASDGAWLPQLASDGVPAYIRAKSGGGGTVTDPVQMQITVTVSNGFASNFYVLFNGEQIAVSGTYTRTVQRGGTFTVGTRTKVKQDYNSSYPLKMNGTVILYATTYLTDVGTEKTETFNVADYCENGITLEG